MPNRVIRPHKLPSRLQKIEETGLVALSVRYFQTSYRGRNQDPTSYAGQSNYCSMSSLHSEVF